MTLTIVPAIGELLEPWRGVHNTVISPIHLTTEDVAQRALRNDLTVAFHAGVLVGNATVRAPEDGAVTVIVRVLPEHRRRGHGSEYLHEVLKGPHAREAEQINTVVLAASIDGLAFAHRHGFVETERYEVEGATFVDLALSEVTASVPSVSQHRMGHEG
jgi:GNAT superfamily N-acetyltransferase